MLDLRPEATEWLIYLLNYRVTVQLFTSIRCPISLINTITYGEWECSTTWPESFKANLNSGHCHRTNKLDRLFSPRLRVLQQPQMDLHCWWTTMHHRSEKHSEERARVLRASTLLTIPIGWIVSYVWTPAHQGFLRFLTSWRCQESKKRHWRTPCFAHCTRRSSIRSESFGRVNFKMKNYPQVVNEKLWQGFWKQMYQQEWVFQIDFTALHHFNLGSFVPIHDH